MTHADADATRTDTPHKRIDERRPTEERRRNMVTGFIKKFT